MAAPVLSESGPPGLWGPGDVGWTRVMQPFVGGLMTFSLGVLGPLVSVCLAGREILPEPE